MRSLLLFAMLGAACVAYIASAQSDGLAAAVEDTTTDTAHVADVAAVDPIGVQLLIENMNEQNELDELRASVLVYFSAPVTGFGLQSLWTDTNADTLTLYSQDMVALTSPPELVGRAYRVFVMPQSGTDMAAVLRDVGIHTYVTYTIAIRSNVVTPGNEAASASVRVNLMSIMRSQMAARRRRLAEQELEEYDDSPLHEGEPMYYSSTSEDDYGVSVLHENSVAQDMGRPEAMQLPAAGEVRLGTSTGPAEGEARQLGSVPTCAQIDGYDYRGSWSTRERRGSFGGRGSFNVWDNWMCDRCREWGPCQAWAGFVRNNHHSFWFFSWTDSYQRTDLYQNRDVGIYQTYWVAGARGYGSLGCGYPPGISNGYPNQNWLTDINKWQNYVTYSCNSGYRLYYSGNVKYCSSNGAGQPYWANPDPVCRWWCASWSVSNGNHGCTNPYQGGYIQGQTCASSCNSGFSRNAGSWSRTCIERAVFDGSALNCVKNCDPLSPPQYGWAVSPRTFFADLGFSGCAAHYAMIGGRPQQKCQSPQLVPNSPWSGNGPVCDWDCYDPQQWTYLPVLQGAPTFGTITNRLAETRCSAPWWEQTSGILVSQCQFQRAWTRPSGRETCTESCGRPWTPEGGTTDCTGHLVGAKCTSKCLKGLVYTGGIVNRFCQADHTWTAGEPTCVHQCPKPSIFGWGKYSCPNMYFGSTCTFTCLPGYGVVAGTTTRVCREYEWTGSDVTCQPLCGNGRVDPANGEECDDGNGMSADGCTVKCRRVSQPSSLSVLVKSTAAQLTGGRLEADFQFLETFAAAKRDVQDQDHAVPLQRTRVPSTVIQTLFAVQSFSSTSFKTFFTAQDLEPMHPKILSSVRLHFREVPHIWDTVKSGNSTVSILNLA